MNVVNDKILNKEKVFALIDCNNFFVSCERVFRPDLIDKPVVVLSNNDGCIIARSNEAKELGIAMGAPYFQCRKLIEKNKVNIFSSNYALYGDISNRVMESIAMMLPEMEVYSIDEAFAELSNFNKNINNHLFEVRTKLLKWLGIPTSIGIGQTKTLAKIANNIAKKCGVFDIRDRKLQDEILLTLSVDEIWGVGKGTSLKLHAIGINNALLLRDADPKYIRKLLGVTGEKMVYELRGISCLELEGVSKRKNIMSSKSFGRPVRELTELQEAIANYAFKATLKLKAQESKAQGIYVYVTSNYYNKKERQYRSGVVKTLISPSNNSQLIIKAAISAIKEIYRPGINYKKCGIILLDLVDSNIIRGDLFAKEEDGEKKLEKIEIVMQNINSKFGENSIYYGVQGTKRNWTMKSNNKSNLYTTNWNEMVLVK